MMGEGRRVSVCPPKMYGVLRDDQDTHGTSVPPYVAEAVEPVRHLRYRGGNDGLIECDEEHVECNDEHNEDEPDSLWIFGIIILCRCRRRRRPG